MRAWFFYKMIELVVFLIFLHKVCNALTNLCAGRTVPLFLVLIFFNCARAADLSLRFADGTDFCATPAVSYSSQRAAVMRACTQHSQCADVFYQRPGEENMALLEHFMMPTIAAARADYLTPLRALFCGENRSVEAIGVAMLVQHALANRNFGQPVCGVNHRPEFNPRTMETSCVCMEDKDCSSSACDLTLFYVLFSVVVVGVGIACLISLCSVWKSKRT